MYQGGVEILAHEDTKHHIKHTERIGRRILKIIPKTKNAVAPIVVLAAYAPHDGYTLGERNQHWALAQETIEQIPTANLCIWRADATGELGNRNRNGHSLRKIIGMDTMGRTKEPGNGRQMRKICTKHELTPMNTWRRQHKTTKHDPVDISTWIHPAGTIIRQIDYIMASGKYRNCVRKTHVIQERRGNLEGNRQNSAIRLGICLRLKKDYAKKNYYLAQTLISRMI